MSSRFLRRLALLAPLGIAFVCTSAIAHAEVGGASLPVRVLSIDSDDALENAEGLTNALRSRVTRSPSISLVEDGASLAVLTAANKCGAKPDAKCEELIGAKLGADRFIWGVLAKAKSGKTVELELHYWRKGEADKVIHKSWPENVKEAQDSSMVDIAKEIIDEVLGTKTGSVMISAKGATEFTIDGVRKVPAEGETTPVDLFAGKHVITANVAGVALSKSVDVPADQTVQVSLEAATEEAASKPFPVKKVLGIGSMVVGAGLMAGGGIAGAPWLFDRERASQEYCGTVESRKNCIANRNGDVRAMQFGYAAAFVGGAGLVGLGAYLAFSPSAPVTGKRVQVMPTFGSTNGISVVGAF